jgi:hypothetical protein
LSETSLARPGREGKRKCKHRARTNAGMFMALTADYRAGRLPVELEQSFEDAVRELRSLYLQAERS